MRIALKFKQRLFQVGQFLVDELENLVVTIASSWDVEHKDDGSHGDVHALTVTCTAPTAAATVLASFNNSNGQVGRIVTTGTGTAYLTTSDGGLKERIQQSTDLSVLRQTKIWDYRWRDGSLGRGVIAQEVMGVLPDASFPERLRRDSRGKEVLDPWAVDYMRFIPELIVGWKEHEREITLLKARLAQLEARVAETR